MLYSFLRFLFKISCRVFFRKFEIKNLEHIPLKGPVILLANHPSTFMDPIVIGASTRRRLFFLAKGEVFKSAFAKWLLPKFNMIPVYRAQDDPTQMYKNKETFQRCFDHLKAGGAILIFPEGISLTERKLKKIKSGAARIALGAENDNNFSLNVKLVCLGLNYSNPHKFQSNLLVNVAPPINAIDYRAKYEQDAFATSNALSDEIKNRLESIIISFDDNDTDKLAADIELIYRSKLLQQLNLTGKQFENKFLANKAIADSVNYFKQHDIKRVEEVRNKLNRYFNLLNQLNLNDRWINKLNNSSSLLISSISLFTQFLIGLPLYIFGVINNYLPYKIPYFLTRKFTDKVEYYGAFSLVLGTFTFLIFYIFQLWLIYHYTNSYFYLLIYFILLPTSGLFAFYYWRRFTDVTGRWQVFSIFIRKASLIASLIQSRTEIIDFIEKGHRDYVNEMAKNAN